MPEYNQYQHFTESDFLSDEFFQSWVFNPGEETNLFWSKFISDNPGKEKEISRARLILGAIEFKEDFLPEGRVREYFNDTLHLIENDDEEKPLAKIRSLNLKWWAAAASIIAILSIGYFFLKNQTTPEIAKVSKPAVIINDVAPGGNKAVLTLGNGKIIILDSAGNGTLSTEGGSSVLKLADGQIVYEGSDEANKEIVYNTISTPAGGQYSLTLSDGSKVWLNAASSLRYPASFSGKDRKVELTGEGYFEVAHNAEKPFHVSVNGADVQVLGTHFNVNAYADEDVMKTTLLEGSVKVSKGNEGVIIKPGQQAEVNPLTNSIEVNNNVNLDEVIAWKNGLFQFDNTGIQNVMRQIGRWYNVEVVFEKGVPAKKITGKIYRNVNASEVFKLLEVVDIHFKIDGKKVTVTK